MHGLVRFCVAATFAAGAGCSFPTEEFRAGAAPADVPRDLGADATLDGSPDAAPDVAPDGTPDVAPDGTPDAADAPPSDGGGCATSAECSRGRVCCDRVCVDVQSSATHCGRCNNVCDPPNGTPACVMGACAVTACDEGFGDCDMSAANGCEVSVSSDATRCGSCTNRCPTPPGASATCTAGRCGTTCNRGLGDCDMSAANGCEADLAASLTSCGACGRVCPAGPNATASCNLGECEVRCAPGFGDCDENPANGCETNLSVTASNCGSCGVACAAPNATPTCTAGACSVGLCNAGFANCDGAVANGCETPTANDITNCGGCGVRCAAGSVCSGGACRSTCTSPLVTCAGACVDTSASLAHCGACGRACGAVANGAAACVGSSCTVGSCSAGFADCDGALGNGCEVNQNTDVANCGGCRVACSRANGTPSCAGGACAIACSAGFSNCDGDPSDGCETATGTDARNCGACGNTCMLPNATATCAAGACAIGTCAAGYASCDRLATNGCETATSSDEANCGRCGAVCPTGQYCVSGACSTVCRPPLTACGLRCVDTTSDAANCGACGRVCAAGFVCSVSRCVVAPPVNDTCAAATDINLAAGARIALSVNMTSATHNLDSPCDTIGGGDVFYRFTLTRRELIYADTFGTPWDTKLFLATSCTAQIRTSQTPGDLVCDDNLGASCTTGGTASQIYTVLPAGTYYLVVSSNGVPARATIRFEHLNIGVGTVALLGRGTSVRAGTTVVSGTSGYSASCGGTGAEQAFWWPTCPEQAAGTLTANTCGRATWNTVLSVVSGAGTDNLCNNDSATCAPQSTLSAPLVAGAGLHALVVDGFSGAGGTYSVIVTRP